MHRPLSTLALACALAACSQPRAPEIAEPLPPPKASEAASSDATAERGTTRLTVYSGDYEALSAAESAQPGMPGYALVSRPLHYSLKSGGNTISLAGLPPAMDVEAALLRTPAAGVTIESQRFTAALSGGRDVMSKVLGLKVTVEHTAGGAKQTDSGILLAASDGLTLALTDGRIKVIRDYDSFSIVDGTQLLPQQAALHWNVRAQDAGDVEFALSYPTGGMAWRAEYLATLAKGADCRLQLDGAALVANRSGVSFTEANLTLVAGEPNRVRKEHAPGPERAMAMDAAAGAQSMPSERASGEYRAYDLPGTTRINSGATERIALFPRQAAIACTRTYVARADAPEWQPPQPLLDPGYRGQTGKLPVGATVSVENTKAAGLGRPLPEGRVRVFDGEDFLGESRLGHTAEGQEIMLEVGNAFDLSAERQNTEFRVDRAGRTITESFAVTLGNAKATDVVIRVIEPLPRWSDWEITSSSVPAKKQDARHAEFAVPVPAGGESTLTYTVRYRWPQGVNP